MRRRWRAGRTTETHLEIRRESAFDLPTRRRQNSACSSRVSCCTRRGLGFAKSSTGLTTKGKAAKRHGLRTSRSASRPIAGLDSEEPMLRQRLRQLTLELRESAQRFHRRNDERAEVAKHLAKVSVGMALAFGAAIVVCLTLSACAVACRASPLVLLIAGASAGGLGALLSRTTVPRNERVRPEFGELLRWDLFLRACIGAAAALLVTAVLLSERLLLLPEGSMAKAAHVVVLGFGAGFSDRFFKSMLGRAIGTRRTRSSHDKE